MEEGEKPFYVVDAIGEPTMAEIEAFLNPIFQRQVIA
jgi:hypothetical protein